MTDIRPLGRHAHECGTPLVVGECDGWCRGKFEIWQRSQSALTAAPLASPDRPQEEPDGGTWPKNDPRRIFVEGAKWWEWEREGATMWPGDRDRAEAEAERRFGAAVGQPALPETPDGEKFTQLVKDLRAEAEQIGTSDRTPHMSGISVGLATAAGKIEQILHHSKGTE